MSVMNLQAVSQALSNPTRINLIKMIGERPLSAANAHKEYIEEYDEKKRESIYRELENLVDASLLKKEYNNREKEIQYKLAQEYLRLDLVEVTIEPIDDVEL